MTSSPLLPWYSLSFAYVPSLAFVCIQAIVLMIVCHASPSEVSGRFIGTIGTIGGNSGGSANGSITNFGTFLFRTFGIGVRVTFGNSDLLCRL